MKKKKRSLFELTFIKREVANDAFNDGEHRRTECDQKMVGGKEETRRFLEKLGFVPGGTVTVVSEIEGNLIVNVKDSRVAIGKDMANKIMV